MVSKRSQEPVMLWELVWFMALVAVGNQILGWGTSLANTVCAIPWYVVRLPQNQLVQTQKGALGTQ